MSVEVRLTELRDGLAGQLPPLPEEPPIDTKGKGKAVARLARDDVVQKMSKQRIESEIKELSGLRDDLALKVWLSWLMLYPVAPSQVQFPG